MNRKVITGPVTFKAEGEPGQFRAVFSTLNVKDADGDVTLPGAFSDGEQVRIAYWGHRWQDLPTGKGVIRADETQAWVEGQFFLQTEAGREHYETVKALGELQQWSYGYDIIEAAPGQHNGESVQFLKRLKVHEVSPVLLGAGVNTRTLDIKAAGEKSIDLGAWVEEIRESFDRQFNTRNANGEMAAREWYWPQAVYDDHVIVTSEGQAYQVNFSRAESGEYEFTPREQWITGAYVFIAGAKSAASLHGELERWQRFLGMSAKGRTDGNGTSGETEGETGNGKLRGKPHTVAAQIDADLLELECGG